MVVVVNIIGGTFTRLWICFTPFWQWWSFVLYDLRILVVVVVVVNIIGGTFTPGSYTHIRAQVTKANLVCVLLLENKK